MTSIIFYGGCNRIGGNKFLVESQGTRLFLDFGKDFAKEKMYYEDPYLEPREVKHFLALGLLPKIEGLYVGDEASHNINGILVSHPHADHYDYIRYTKSDIKIYCSKATQNAIVAYDKSGREKVEFKIAHLTQKIDEVKRSFTPFSDVKQIDSFEVEAWAVDHSAPGARALILHSQNASIVYTGDFRLHGPLQKETEEFIERAAESEVDALLIEGTNILEADISSEEEVQNKISNVIADTDGLVMIGLMPKDLTRLETVYRATIKNDRALAISMKQAFLISSLQEDGSTSLNKKASNILAFKREKSRYDEYEKRVEKDWKVVSSEDVKNKQGEIVLITSLYDMNETIDIKPKSGSVYILSESEPFDEEGEITFKKLLSWLEYWGIPMYKIHCSGHATPRDLKRTILKIKPTKVFPIHTSHPELFKKYIEKLECEVEIPIPGKLYEIS